MTGFYVEHDRDVLNVRGSDARKFLHSQLANDVASLKVGESQYSLLLEPTGKITSLLRVHCKSDEDFVLDCDAGFGEVSAIDRKSTRLNSSHTRPSRMPSSA